MMNRLSLYVLGFSSFMWWLVRHLYLWFLNVSSFPDEQVSRTFWPLSINAKVGEEAALQTRLSMFRLLFCHRSSSFISRMTLARPFDWFGYHINPFFTKYTSYLTDSFQWINYEPWIPRLKRGTTTTAMSSVCQFYAVLCSLVSCICSYNGTYVSDH